MQTLAALAPFVPLGQTMLWVILIVGLLIWFRRPVRSILDSIQKRIEAGSTVKAGWFELSGLQPQPAEVQRQRVETEAREAIGHQEAPESGTPSRSLLQVQTSLLQAEDLALRAVQSEYRVALSRNLQAGAGTELDAAFFKEGKLFVVEVKVFFGSVSPIKLRNAAAKLLATTSHLRGLSTHLLLVLVFKRSEDIAANEARVSEALQPLDPRFEIRMYSLPELREQFGADAGDA